MQNLLLDLHQQLLRADLPGEVHRGELERLPGHNRPVSADELQLHRPRPLRHAELAVLDL